MREAQIALDKGKKNALVLPVEKIHPLLVKEVLGYRIDYQVTVYIVAVLEYIAADILKLTGNYVRNIKHQEITSQDIKVAICADPVLMDMFSQEEDVSLPLIEEPIRGESLTYEEIIKDFILEENQYMRDLNMIIKVFRAPFVQLFPRSKDLEVIFSNILDVYEFTAKLVSSVEDQVEVAAEKETPTVGICLQDVAEEEGFSCYEKYVDDMLAPHGKERLNTLLQREDITTELANNGHGFKDATKYVLPKLLLGPIYHCLHYFEVIKALINTSPNEEDQDCLEQAYGLLTPLKVTLERRFSGNFPKKKPWETSLRLQGRVGRQAVLQKMTELQKSIDGWEGKDIWQSCSEFILEGVMNKHVRGKPTERHAFLFDSMIILCKQNLRRSSVTAPTGEFKLKEKYYIRKLEIKDRDDCEEFKHGFEIQTKVHPHSSVILVCKSQEEKSNWMAALISLQTRSMLERRLDGVLKEEERAQPLLKPPKQLYRFADEDSEENIVFEPHQGSTAESPLIKGGTILKLVERLTYHMYADPNFVRTFLTTFRSFCSPQELLDLLIERFNIADPIELVHNADIDCPRDNLQCQNNLKRFRKEYVKPVQFRVVNVLRHWVDHHFYDFKRDVKLRQKLMLFLDSVKGKAMRKMAESILKVISRKAESVSTEREFTLPSQFPPIEWHLTKNYEEFDLMMLHPIEIARQVTLLEFEYYRAVQPSELVGSVWSKKDKKYTSPNLLKLIEFTNNFTFWMEKCIVEAENIEERMNIVCRIIEIMCVFQELNNFNGVLEIVSAIESAPVHRLEHTFADLPNKFLKAFNEAKELNADHFKKYIEKLRSINPPCVPFFGMYLTNILLTEEGNPDFLPNRPKGLINFSKRRKVAEITGEIQQYQNQPYALDLQPDIKRFFVNLNPLNDMEEKEFNDYLYNKSLEIEPRNSKQPIKAPRKTEYSLKSPGIKPSNRHSTASKSHGFQFGNRGYQRINEEESSPVGSTPPTPTTPLSPPASSATSDTSVFANLITGQGSVDGSLTSSGIHSESMNSINSASSDMELLQTLRPPPVPPRIKYRNSTSGDIFSLRSTSPPDPPAVPPREPIPPVPPRRESMYSTLPRTQSLSHPQRPVSGQHVNVFSNTLPHYTSERDSGAFVNVNGEHGIPDLPPKTYRNAAARKQSS
ncbi:hypothetical protein ScPMuIL_013548 [Solemya velum]